MTATIEPTRTAADLSAGSVVDRDPVVVPSADERPPRTGRARWPIFGAVGAATGWVAVLVSMPSNVTEEDTKLGADVIDKLDRSGYHAGFLLGMVSVGCLLVAASGWKRWAERRAPQDLAARTLSQGIAATATINVVFYALMGSMALYMPGGTDAGWLSKQQLYTNYTLLDFGGLLGWWGVAVTAICAAVLAFRKDRVLPRWMGVLAVVTLLPALLMAVGTALPGFVGLTMPIWLAAVSIGMIFSKTADA